MESAPAETRGTLSTNRSPVAANTAGREVKMVASRNLAAIGAVAVMIALTCLTAVAVLSGPGDGFRLVSDGGFWQAGGVRLRAFGAGGDGSGIADGDVLTAVDGVPLSAVASALTRRDPALGRWSVGGTHAYTIVHDGRVREATITLTRYPWRSALAETWDSLLAAGLFIAIGGVVVWRAPAHPAGAPLLLCGGGVLGGIGSSVQIHVADLVNRTPFRLWLVTDTMAWILVFTALLHFALVFPAPRPFVARHPSTLPAVYLAPVLGHAAWIALSARGAANPLDWAARWEIDLVVLNGLYLVLAVAFFALNLLTVREPVLRARSKWVMLSFLLIGAAWAALSVAPQLLVGHPLVGERALSLVGLLFPLSIAVGIVRSRLFDIDRVLSRGLLWALLSLFVVAVHALVAGLAGSRVGQGGNRALSILAAGLIAVAFQPLRGRLQRAVDRYVYGERDDPYAVVSRLGERLASGHAADTVLPGIAETVAKALKLPYVGISIGVGPERSPAASFGAAIGGTTAFPLLHRSAPIGELTVAPRTPGEAFSAADRRLLASLAPHIGAATHAVQLATDLRRSRERIVTAREDERRRLRRDLHDGLGPSLAGMTLKLDAARNLLPRDAAAVDALLAELSLQSRAAIADVRRAVQGLRPPARDELGLVAALRAQAVRHGPPMAGASPAISISIDAFPADAPLPAAAEVAAYRIAVEAMANAVRHSGATRCRVTLTVGESLVVAVEDDGRGFSPQLTPGAGLTAMRERAEELGGSLLVESGPGRTRVTASLPLEAS